MCAGIVAFLLEKMAQIFTGHGAKQPSTTPMHRRQLKVDHGGEALWRHQPVLRLGEVIVRDITFAHLTQDAPRVAVKRRIRRFREVERHAFGPAAKDAFVVYADQVRSALDPCHNTQGFDFFSGQKARDGFGPKRHAIKFAQDKFCVFSACQMARHGFRKLVTFMDGRGDKILARGHDVFLSARPCGV